MYKFLLCQPDPRFSDTGWYLELRPDDPETVLKVHKGVTRFYYAKFGPRTVEVPGCNPLDLVARWLSTVEQHLMAGVTLVVNSSGGWLPKDKVVVVAERESERLVWPTDFDDETITISRWPDGTHWYLCSNKDRIFVPDKYCTYEAAYKAARAFVPKDRINRGEK